MNTKKSKPFFIVEMAKFLNKDIPRYLIYIMFQRNLLCYITNTSNNLTLHSLKNHEALKKTTKNLVEALDTQEPSETLTLLLVDKSHIKLLALAKLSRVSKKDPYQLTDIASYKPNPIMIKSDEKKYFKLFGTILLTYLSLLCRDKKNCFFLFDKSGGYYDQFQKYGLRKKTETMFFSTRKAIIPSRCYYKKYFKLLSTTSECKDFDIDNEIKSNESELNKISKARFKVLENIPSLNLNYYEHKLNIYNLIKSILNQNDLGVESELYVKDISNIEKQTIIKPLLNYHKKIWKNHRERTEFIIKYISNEEDILIIKKAIMNQKLLFEDKNNLNQLPQNNALSKKYKKNYLLKKQTTEYSDLNTSSFYNAINNSLKAVNNLC